MKPKLDFDYAEIIVFADAVTFDSWLANNYAQTSGVWLKIAKTSSGIPSITSDEAVDVGLCWGWISGLRKSYDESYYLQKYVPRRPHSVWSQINVEKVKALTRACRMQIPGLAEVETAKADGRWGMAYVSQRNATLPPELIEALGQNAAANHYFNKLNKTDRYAVILQLAKERTPKSKIARLNKLIAAMNIKGERPS